MESLKPEEEANFQTFRECLSTNMLRRNQPAMRKIKKGRASSTKVAVKNAPLPTTSMEHDREEPEEIAEFINVGGPLLLPHTPC